MALQNSSAHAAFGIPYSHAGIERACSASIPVECNGVYLTEVSRECSKTAAVGDTPDPRGGIVRARDDDVTVYCKASNTGLMTDQNVFADTRLQIPNPQRRISGPRDGSVGIGHLEASDRGGVSSQHMNTPAILHIPHPHITVTSAGHKDIFPGHHGPDAHDMPLKRFLVITHSVEYMYFGIVHSDHNILVGQM